MKTLEDLKISISSLSLFNNREESTILRKYCNLIESLEEPLPVIVGHWTNFYGALVQENIGASLPDALFSYVLSQENPFTVVCSKGEFAQTESHLRMAAKRDLDTLWFLSLIKPEQIKASLTLQHPQYEKEIHELPNWVAQHLKYTFPSPWGDGLPKLVDFYQINGFGSFALGNFFKTNQNFVIEPILEVAKNHTPPSFVLPILEEYLNHFVTESQGIHQIFVGDVQDILGGFRELLKEEKYQSLKVMKITLRDLSRFDSLIERIQQHPCKFILILDDPIYIYKHHKTKLAVAMGEQGLQVQGKNISFLGITKEPFATTPAMFTHTAYCQERNQPHE